MVDLDDDNDPNQLWCIVAGLQVRKSLWFVTTAATSGIMVNVLAFQFHRDMLHMSRDNEKYCVPYAFILPMISLFSGVFQTNRLLLFSGAPALVLSIVTLYLMYMMKLYTGNKTYSRSLLTPLERFFGTSAFL